MPGTAAEPQVDEQKIRAQLKKWQERLLDLTKANPLLGLNRSRASKLRVTSPKLVELFNSTVSESELRLPLALRKSQRPLLDDSEAGGDEGYEIQPGDVEFEATAVELARKLRRIHDNGRTSVEERGVTTLHLTFGALNWRDDWLGESTSPIWMVPVKLVSKGANAPLRLTLSDEEMQINPALELYLRERHRVRLPEIPEDPTDESLTKYLEDVQRAVRDQSWSVIPDVWLSTFSFESLVIYQDLKAMAELAITHPVVAALARATVVANGTYEIGANLDELQAPETVPIPVLPADGSQLEALTLGTAGAHLVIHGPPGTGKSQTIANLIADALGRNKRVLFVSSKMAALNVVHQRLSEKNLTRFCLEAHSTKAGKAKIIDELRRTLETDILSDGGRFEENLSVLLHVRADLNRYVQELHRVQEPFSKTLYQAIGRIAKLVCAPEVRAPLPWANPLTASRSEFLERYDLLSELSAQANVFDDRNTHPWRGFSPTTLTITDREQLEEDLVALVTATKRLQQLIPDLQSAIDAHDLSISEFRQLQPALESVAALDRLPQNWYASTPEQLAEKAKLFETAAGLTSDFEEQYSIYLQTFDLPLEQASRLLEPVTQQFLHTYQKLLPSYWKWRSTLRQNTRPGTKVRRSTAAYLYKVVRRLIETNNWFAENQADIAVEVGCQSIRNREALIGAAIRCRAAAQFAAVLLGIEKPRMRQAEIPERFRQATNQLPAILSESFVAAVERLDQNWPKGFVDDASAKSATTKEVIERTTELAGGFSRIQEWVTLQRTLQKCARAGLTPFLTGLGSVSGKAAPEAFERRFYQLWISAVTTQSDVLTTFSAVHREELIRKFESLDNSVRALVALHIQSKAADSAIRLRTAQSTVTGSEVSLLRHELQKRKRIKPLRKLFAEIPHALQALKPCMLMSPISVSTFLKPGSITFDLVVFDEASQLPTPEGIAAILRARQVVVAGDRNQLPPTSFFTAQIELDEAEDAEENGDKVVADEPLESLLDDAVASVPLFREAHLKWHYRSRDERLIKFSNAQFYDNQLVTFPSACTDTDGRGVRLEYVADGVWDRGRSRTNRVEARRVADLVVQHFTTFPNRSLGVVSMNAQQKEAIEDAIAESLKQNPDILPLMDSSPHEPFFVKALENVQGDERDAMIISVGYGKDTNGHLGLNLGPLNMEGGWRRLNVLITRAKWQTTLVTSIRSYELSAISPKNKGAIALRDFITYAERHCELPESASIPTAEETNDFEDAVATGLRDRGLVVDQQVGASKFRIDIGIRDRRELSRYVLGVECDGATYHSTRTARDRDILRQRVLESMGWRIHRVWSTEWFHDRERAIERILSDLTLAEGRPVEESVQGAPMPHSRSAPDSVPSTARPRNTDARAINRRYQPGMPYRRFTGTADRDVLIQPRCANQLAALIVRIVETEGPIHEDFLAERLKEICGVERAGVNVHSNIGEAIHIAVRQKQLERRRQRAFLWRNGNQLNRFRIPTNSLRCPIEWIHQDEIALAILYLVEDQFGLIKSELARSIARLFGIDRMTVEASDQILEVADELVEQNLLHEDAGRLSLHG